MWMYREERQKEVDTNRQAKHQTAAMHRRTYNIFTETFVKFWRDF